MNIYVAGVIRRGTTFLLTRHIHIGPPVWLMPGGKPEGDESAKEALVRELKQELGIDVVDCRFFQAFFNQFGGKEWLGLFFIVSKYTGEPRLMESGKHDELVWLTCQQILELTNTERPERDVVRWVIALEEANRRV